MWLSVLGRGPMIAIAKNGDPVSVVMDIMGAVFAETYKRVRQVNLVQPRAGEIQCRVVPYDENEMETIRRYFLDLFETRAPGCFHVTVKSVPQVTLTLTGKHRFFVGPTMPDFEPANGEQAS